MDAKIICPNCGKENAVQTKFCIYCGSSVNNVEQNEPVSYDTSSDRYCDHCGYKLSHGDVFCNNCGFQLGVDNYNPQINGIPAADKNHKKHRPLLVLLLVLSLMVICGFVFIPDVLEAFDWDFSTWLNTKKTTSTSPTETTFATQSTTTSTTQTTTTSRIQKQTYYVGQVVTMGEFEQDNNIGNGKESIKWDVLDVQSDRALLIAHDLMEYVRYNQTRTAVTWETSYLRKWMNNDFYNAAFSADEQNKILSVQLNNRDSSIGTDGGNDTYDKVFSLSVEEAKKYYSSNSQRIAYYTDYVEQYKYYGETNAGREWWWLRSPGATSKHAALVDIDGKIIDNYGDYVDDYDITVRPAMWISI